MVLTTLTDGLGRGLDTITGAVSETFFEPVVRLGVTGLARSGKTVFITALVANLLDRGRMGGMAGVAKGAITAAYLRPQPDDTVARFPYEANLAQLTGTTPAWPAPTAAISELRLSFRVRPQGLLGAVAGPRTVHLDIVDYPGEWLLDLALMNRSYAEWSEATLARLPHRPGGAEALAAQTDDAELADKLAEKVWHLRLLDDAEGVMNESLAARHAAGQPAEALVVSQFTLYATTDTGRRPSWNEAARPAHAEPLIDRFAERLRALGAVVATGRFRTEMRVELVNDGPMTILVEA